MTRVPGEHPEETKNCPACDPVCSTPRFWPPWRLDAPQRTKLHSGQVGAGGGSGSAGPRQEGSGGSTTSGGGLTAGAGGSDVAGTGGSAATGGVTGTGTGGTDVAGMGGHPTTGGVGGTGTGGKVSTGGCSRNGRNDERRRFRGRRASPRLREYGGTQGCAEFDDSSERKGAHVCALRAERLRCDKIHSAHLRVALQRGLRCGVTEVLQVGACHG